jgi:hypothetical protein
MLSNKENQNDHDSLRSTDLLAAIPRPLSVKRYNGRGIAAFKLVPRKPRSIIFRDTI